MAKGPQKGQITMVGDGCVIEGSLAAPHDVRVEGTVRGKVETAGTLTVSPSGVVEADIQTTNVTVSGQVTGNIAASERVELKADGRMVGDIKSPRILIADGASFKGNVDMDV